jgi:hypothetical protein
MIFMSISCQKPNLWVKEGFALPCYSTQVLYLPKHRYPMETNVHQLKISLQKITDMIFMSISCQKPKLWVKEGFALPCYSTQVPYLPNHRYPMEKNVHQLKISLQKNY